MIVRPNIVFFLLLLLLQMSQGTCVPWYKTFWDNICTFSTQEHSHSFPANSLNQHLRRNWVQANLTHKIEVVLLYLEKYFCLFKRAYLSCWVPASVVLLAFQFLLYCYCLYNREWIELDQAHILKIFLFDCCVWVWLEN